MSPILRSLPLCVALVLTQQAVAEPVGNVEALVGEAYGTPPAGVRRPLELALALVQDEYVETKAGGGMTVRFLDGTEFRLGSDSSAMLDRFLFDPTAASEGNVVQLGQGVFRFISGAGQSHDGVQIQTPNSTIGIRGTDFVVKIAPGSGTTLGTVSGQIEVTALLTGETFTVDPGLLGRVEPDGTIAVEPAPVPVEELACWLATDTYICLAEAGPGSATTGEDADTMGGSDAAGGGEAGPGPGPGPGPSDPGDDSGNDPGEPSDPGSDPSGSDPSGGSPSDGDPK